MMTPEERLRLQEQNRQSATLTERLAVVEGQRDAAMLALHAQRMTTDAMRSQRDAARTAQATAERCERAAVQERDAAREEAAALRRELDALRGRETARVEGGLFSARGVRGDALRAWLTGAGNVEFEGYSETGQLKWWVAISPADTDALIAYLSGLRGAGKGVAVSGGACAAVDCTSAAPAPLAKEEEPRGAVVIDVGAILEREEAERRAAREAAKAELPAAIEARDEWAKQCNAASEAHAAALDTSSRALSALRDIAALCGGAVSPEASVEMHLCVVDEVRARLAEPKRVTVGWRWASKAWPLHSTKEDALALAERRGGADPSWTLRRVTRRAK